MIAIGKVVSVDDIYNGERIKVRLNINFDKGVADDKLPYAWPLLPKMIHVKPKVNEAVLVFFEDERGSMRYYLGPIISQPEFIDFQDYSGGATSLMKGGPQNPSNPSKHAPENGSMMKNAEIGIYGRKNCDIILSDNDVRIRCGVHDMNNGIISFNKNNPAFLKLKYYPNGGLMHAYTQYTLPTDMTNSVPVTSVEKIGSAATLVADKINLISNNGSPYFSIDNTDESISDKTLMNILDNAHQLPYGDKLCELLSDLIYLVMNHTHNYHKMPICQGDAVKKFISTYGMSKGQIGRKILSDNIRIN